MSPPKTEFNLHSFSRRACCLEFPLIVYLFVLLVAKE